MLGDVLILTEGLPSRTLAPGETLFTEGDESASVIVLVEGELVVEAGGAVIDRHTAPGTIVGETGALLRQPRSATARAVAPTVVREIGDPPDFFASHPEFGLEIARQLAGRLYRLTAYVADVQRHYSDRDDHLAMFGDMIHRIAARPPVDIDPGSDRSPDY